MTLKETAERELFSKTELLRTVEEHHMIYVRKLRADHQVFAKGKDWEMYGREMEYEDIRSYTRQLYKDNETNKLELQMSRAQYKQESEARAKFEEQLI